MTSYPTDLTAEEERRVRTRLAALAEELTASGDLRTQAWREAFLATWRHPYVPAYYPSMDQPPVLCVDPDRRASWLDAVYSNQTLVTKVQPIPLDRAFRPATSWMYTSSSTLPSLVQSMLEALDIRDGHRVLEVGTGSGYNCALLCQRLGGEYVTSVDIDHELTELARERLAANGHAPTLAVADGAEGYPAGAPYDRIISTCAVGAIPTAWLKQAASGAVIITDVHGLLGGTLVRLTVEADGTATGRFVPYWAGFMELRHTTAPARPPAIPVWADDETTAETTTDIDPSLFLRDGEIFGFLAQWELPDVIRGPAISNRNRPAVRLGAADGSQAIVESQATDGRYRVTQIGSRRLWDTIERLHQLWHDTDRPSFDRFGLTATAAEQYVWLDDPAGPHRWLL